MIIRDQDKAGDPVLVTELNDGNQINVPGSKDTNSKNSNSTVKKVVQFPKSKKSTKDDFDINEEEFSDSDEDSDDPSWGSSKRSKKKNVMKGKKRKRKY